MAKYSQSVDFRLTTSLDNSGITKLQAELRSVQTELQKLSSMDIIKTSSAQEAVGKIKEIENALTKAFNSNIGMLDLKAFTNSLSAGNRSIADWQKSFSKAGAIGTSTMNNLVGRIGRIDEGLKSVSKTTDKVFNTIGNTVRWGLIASAFQSVMNSAHSAVDYIKELDKSLNDIRIVSDYNAQQMREFSLYANDAAESLGQTTVAYTNASLIFAQQGYDLETANKFADLTLKVANTTGQETAEVSEQITAWTNGYQMSLDQLGETLDKVTKVAATSAADTEELMTAASRVAATASTLGTTEDELIAQMATIISVTREAPENIGNSLKTIYARMGDLSLGETLEDGVDLGQVSKTLDKIGVSVLDTSGKMRDMGDIMEDLMNRWNDLDQGEKQAAAIKIAGKFQYNRLMTLMENQDMYRQYLDDAAQGAEEHFLDTTQDIYMESLEAKMTSLQAAGEGLISSIFNPDDMKPFIESLTAVVDLLTQFTDSLGSGQTLLTGIAALGTQIFSKNIAQGLGNFLNNRDRDRTIKDNEAIRREMLAKGASEQAMSTEGGQQLVDTIASISKNTNLMSPEQQDQYNKALDETIIALEGVAKGEEKLKTEVEAVNKLYHQFDGDKAELIKQNKDGSYNFAEFETLFNRQNQYLAFKEGVSQAAGEISSAYNEVYEDIEKLNNLFRKTNFAPAHNQEAVSKIDALRTRLEQLNKTGVITSEEFLRFDGILDRLKTAKTSNELNNISTELNEAGADALEAATAINTLAEKMERTSATGFVESMEQDANGINKAAAAAETGQVALDGLNGQLERTSSLQALISGTGGIASIAFALQSLSNIPSIWSEEDADIGKNILSTLMNLAITLPMVFSGIQQVSEGYKEFQKILKGQTVLEALDAVLSEKIAKTKEKAAVAATADAVATEAEAASHVADAEATVLENAALTEKLGLVVKNSFSNIVNVAKRFWPALVAIAATSLAIGIADAVHNAWKNNLEEIAEDLESSNALLDAVEQQRSALQEGSKEYKKTGEASDSYKNALLETAEALDISNAKLLIAQGRYEALAKEIENATQKELEYNSAKAKEQIAELNSGDFFGNGSSRTRFEDNTSKSNNTFQYYADPYAYNAVEQTSKTILSDQEALFKKREAYLETTQKIKDLEAEQSKLLRSDIDYEQKKKSIEEQITSLKQIQKDYSLSENEQTKYDNWMKIADNAMQSLFNKDAFAEDQTYRDVFETLLSDRDLQSVYYSMGEKEGKEFIDGYVAQVAETMPDKTAEAVTEAMQSTSIYKGFESIKNNSNFNEAWTNIFNSLSRTSRVELFDGVDWDEEEDILYAELTDIFNSINENTDFRIQILADAEALEESVAAAVEAITNGDELGEEQILPLLQLDDNMGDIIDLFQELGGMSNSLEDMFSTLVDGSAESKLALIELDEAAEDVEHTIKEMDFDEAVDSLNRFNSSLQFDEVGTAIDGMENLGERLEEIDGILQHLEETAAAADFDLAGDLIDQANAIEGVIDSLDAAAQGIAESFQVPADAIEDLARAFPGILEGYQITADGMVQLNEQVARSALEAAGVEVDASAQSIVAKMTNQANYMNAMADMYEQQAAGYAAMAENEALTEQELSEYEAQCANEVAQIKQDYHISEEEAARIAAENESQYSDESGNNISENFASAASSADASMGSLTSNMATYMSNISNNAHQAAAAVKGIGEGNPNAGGNISGIGTIGTSGSSYSGKRDISAGNIINATVPLNSGQTISAFNGAQAAARQKAANAQALASAYRNGAAALVANAASLQASNAGFGDKIRNSYGTGKGSGGKSGGGSKEKEYTPKEKETIEEEIDLYERVDTMLNAIAADYDLIAKEQSRLTGHALVDNMNKQIKLLQRQISLQKEKLSIQENEASGLRSELSSYGVTFDNEGFINNYATILKQLEGNVNSAIGSYNATTTEEGQTALEGTIDAAQNSLDAFKDAYKRYDELVSSDMKDTKEALEDLEDQIEDLRIEAFKTSVDAADNIKDLNEKLIEFNEAFTGRQSDDPFRAMSTSASKLAGYFDIATESANNYYDTLIARAKEFRNAQDGTAATRAWWDQKIQEYQKAKQAIGDGTMEFSGTGYLDMNLTAVRDILSEIDEFNNKGYSAIFGENSADLYDVAKQVFEQATDLISDYEGEIDSLRDAILEAIDDIGDRIDERFETYELIVEELEHQRDILELLHGDRAYDDMNKILAAQQTNYQQQIREYQQYLTYWKDLQKGMKEGSEAWKKIQEQINDATSAMNDMIETSLENLREQYENTVNGVLDKYTDALVGDNSDLDWLDYQWEMINKKADYYLDDVNKAYEIQTLQGKYLKLLEESEQPAIQRQITEQMQQQLDYLREKTNLSQYDVAYANAQLEILQKQIALEDAQRNKTQMKLRRDTQGNYSYVYTADKNGLGDAEQELLDAQNNAYNLSKDQIKATQDDAISALKDMMNQLKNIALDTTLTQEEAMERQKKVMDDYRDYIGMISEQLNTSESNIINDFVGMVDALVEENKLGLTDIYDEIKQGNDDAFSAIDERWGSSLNNWVRIKDEYLEQTDILYENLTNALDSYHNSVKDMSGLIKQDFDNLNDAISKCNDSTQKLAQSQKDFITQLHDDAGMIKDYYGTLDEYQNKIAKLEGEMNAYVQKVNQLQKTITTKEQENVALRAEINTTNNTNQNVASGYGSSGGSGSKTSSAGGSSGNTNSGGSIGVGSTVKLKSGHYYHADSSGGGPHGNWSDATKVTHTNPGAAYPIHLGTQGSSKAGGPNSGWRGWVRQSDLVGYDTGGYTGTWSQDQGVAWADSGKLAFLHQKEIVLNPKDTENILMAVDAVRSMTTSLKQGMFDSIINLISGQSTQLTPSTDIEQNVHITAEFPNVNDSREIEQALLGLNNRAIQYAYKTK